MRSREDVITDEVLPEKVNFSPLLASAWDLFEDPKAGLCNKE